MGKGCGVKNGAPMASRSGFETGSRLGVLFSHLCKALAAVHGAIGLGLKRNSCLAAASCANSSVVLTRATCSHLAGVTAGLAALWLVLETALCIKLLLTSGEHELVATLFANQGLVFVHVESSL